MVAAMLAAVAATLTVSLGYPGDGCVIIDVPTHGNGFAVCAPTKRRQR